MSNDRFKFRAWDKENKIMHKNAECAYDSMNGTPPLMHDSFGSLLDDDNFIIEQCTGLTDKNGKLIFEGDILQAPGQTIAYNVKWAHHGFVLKTGFSSAKSYPMSSCDMFEIIGNIHEMEVTE